MGDAMGPHVAQHRDRKHARRPVHAVGRLELAVQAVRRRRARQLADHRLAAFGVRNQHGLAETCLDRGGGMADMEHERTAADRGAVDPGRRDAEIMRDLLRRFDRGGDAVDIGQFQAGIGNGVERRVGVQLDLRHVGNDAEFGGLGGADDGDCVSAHRA